MKKIICLEMRETAITLFCFWVFIVIFSLFGGCSDDDTTIIRSTEECIGHPHKYKHFCPPCELKHCDGHRGRGHHGDD